MKAMDVKARDKYKQQARIMKALANETRLIIVDRLSKGECQVGELVRLIGMDQSTVSKHLATLRAAGVVDDDRRGNAVFYTLATPCVVNFFACASRVLEERI
jgi:DNA-binding transcriptional ArsR family regulator